MEQIKFTRLMTQGLLGTFFGVGGSAIGSPGSNLYVMKGAVPTPDQIKAATVQYVTTTRSADILMSYSLQSTATVVNNVVTIANLPYTACQTSGTATWFAMCVPANNSATAQYVVIGDISDANGSGFLRLNDVNLVAGTVYRTLNMKFVFPYEFNL